MSDRRAFLRSLGVLLAASSLSSRARADEEAHPVPPPDGFEFKTLVFEKSVMMGKTATAIAAVPRDLPPGARLPLAVILPGGEHGKEKPEHGCWGWWSDFHLADLLATIRRGRVTGDDVHGLMDPAQLDTTNAELATNPWRGIVIVTPWVLSRQTDPRPHGEMVTPFLRTLVERARAELPVIPTRAATGLGGCSVGGLWSLYCGSALSDLFSTLVAVQPFTEDLDRLIRKAVAARTTPQRVRLVTALSDRLHPMNVHLAKLLRKDGVEVELVEYRGDHNAQFPSGPGGLDMLLAFDRGLDRSASPPASASASASPPSASTSPSASISASPSPSAPASASSSSSRKWIVAAGVSALALGALTFARARRGRASNV